MDLSALRRTNLQLELCKMPDKSEICTKPISSRLVTAADVRAYWLQRDSKDAAAFVIVRMVSLRFGTLAAFFARARGFFELQQSMDCFLTQLSR